MIETSPVDVAAFWEAWSEGQQQRVSHQETMLTIIDQTTHCDQSHPRWRGHTGTVYYHFESTVHESRDKAFSQRKTEYAPNSEALVVPKRRRLLKESLTLR